MQDFKTHIGGAKRYELPPDIRADFQRARTLEWITVGYLLSVIVVMYLAMGSSAAMKAAWVEDIVSTFPALAFLLAARIYDKASTAEYAYGYHKAFTLAFVAGSLALLVLGLSILVDSTISLIKQEHPTIGTIELLGTPIWLGWLMIMALIYSSVPALILGRKKLPLAKRLHQKTLYVDAEAQKADWMTALASIAGIIGIGFGLWWSDAVAAIFISLNIVYDGVSRTRDSMKDLMDELPKTYDNKNTHPLLHDVVATCLRQPWVANAQIRMREHGMVFFGDIQVIPKTEDQLIQHIAQLRQEIEDLDWKIHDVIICPVNDFTRADKTPSPLSGH